MNIILVMKKIDTADRYKQVITTQNAAHHVMCFEDIYTAYDYLTKNTVNIAIIDVELQGTIQCSDGISLAQKIKKEFTHTMVVLCHYDGSYIRQHNLLGIDYYLVTPISDKILISTVEKMCRFDVFEESQIIVVIKENLLSITMGDTVVDFRGKMKTIMETIIRADGKNVTHKEIFSIAWPGRPYSNVEMKVYYNALHRIRKLLTDSGMDTLMGSSRYSLKWMNSNTAIYSENECCENN